MTTNDLKQKWIDYVDELLRLKWSLKYGTPEYMRVSEIVLELKSIIEKLEAHEPAS